MKKLFLLTLMILLLLGTGAVCADTPAPTQTPYIVYVVVTATPEPEDLISRTEATETAAPISLANLAAETPTAASEISLVNDTDSSMNAQQLVEMVVSTLTAQTSTTAGGSEIITRTDTETKSVTQSDGSACTLGMQVISAPATNTVARGAIFWTEWVVQNTGTCTWTPDWYFVFDTGWQIGNTRFTMNKTTAPGETLKVRLALRPDQRYDGTYYSTYVLTSPSGDRCGTITVNYQLKGSSWYDPKPTPPCWECGPQHGRPAGPGGPGGPGGPDRPGGPEGPGDNPPPPPK